MLRLLYSRNWPLLSKLVPLAVFALYLGAVALVAQIMTQADPYTRYALAWVVVQSSTLALVTSALLVNKVIAIRLEARRTLRMDGIADRMAGYAIGNEPEDALLRYAAHYPSDFLKVWERSLANLSGSARDRVIGLLSSTGLDARLRAKVSGPDPGQAVWAISLLRDLNQPSSLAAIEEALNHPAETVRASAFFALAAHGSEAQQDKVFALLPGLPFWQRIVLFQQVRADSPALTKYLAGAFLSSDRTVVLAALEFVLSRERLQLLGPAVALASSADLEIRIKFFKALPLLATTEDPSHLVEAGLSDPDWRVRAMAARACGILHLPNLTALLVKQLTASDHPAETGHLARALAALGGESLMRLYAFTTSDNEMTRAVAAEVLEKAFLAPEQTLVPGATR